MSQNDHNPISNESSSESLRSICDRFKAAWLAGSKPRIEEFLNQSSEDSSSDDPKNELLLGLVKKELELRMQNGEIPAQSEYEERFPDHATEIEKLFRVFKKTSLDERPVFESADDFSLKEGDSSRQIGPYKLLQKLGEGGMGAVYMADQVEPVRRRVALKLIKSGMDSKQVVARFEAERQALAMMDHQNIAKVLDAGITDEGKPYFAMELVQGMPITKYCDREKLSISDRLSLFVQVCRALQHAHQKGVIHRDIKPSNVLVTQRDGIPMAKVIDFGLAKALQPEHRLTDKTLFTEFGQVCGTLEYMSPEQAEMNEFGLDTRTDVYSLGILLYELLTGSTPLERERFTDAALHQVIKMIITEDPPRPSRRLSDSGEAIAGISEQRRLEPRRLSGILKGELDWVALKALDKDRNRRYDSASALADDVQKYLDGDVVGARPPSASYRLRKSIRKHKTPFIVGTLFMVLLLVGFASTGVMWLRASKAETVALEEAKRARASEADAQYNYEIAENNAYNANMVLVQRDWENGELVQLQSKLGRFESKGFVWSYWHRLLNSASAVFDRLGSPHIACFSPDGKNIASDEINTTVLIWDSTNGEKLRQLTGHRDRVREICYSPDGEMLVTAAPGNEAAEIKIWDVATGKELFSLEGHTGRVNNVKFNQDATLIVTASDDKSAKSWEAKTGKLLHSFENHASEVKCALFDNDDQHVISAGINGTIGHWDPMTGQIIDSKKLPFPHNRSVMSLSPSGSQLAVAVVTNGTDNNIRFFDTKTNAYNIEFWDTNTSVKLRTLKGHQGYVNKIAYSNDEKRVVIATQDGTIKVWDVSSGKTLCTHLECGSDHYGSVRTDHIAFSADDEHILSVADGSAKDLGCPNRVRTSDNNTATWFF